MSQTSKYTREFKAIVALDYMLSGSSQATAKKHNMARRTLDHWVKDGDPEFQQALEECKAQYGQKTIAAYNNILTHTLARLDERIQKGNAVMKKDGSIGYMPVPAKDLAIIAGIAHEKKALAEGTVRVSPKDSARSREAVMTTLKLAGTLQRALLDLKATNKLDPEVLASLESEAELASAYVKLGDDEALGALIQKVNNMSKMATLPPGNLPN